MAHMLPLCRLYRLYTFEMYKLYATYGIRRLLSSAEHFPIGHRLRPVKVSHLRDVRVQEHEMGHGEQGTPQHDRILLVQVHTRGIVAAGPVHEINGFPPGHSHRKHWYGNVIIRELFFTLIQITSAADV